LIVLDSSAGVDYLLGAEHGEWVTDRLASDSDVHVPHLFDLEILNAIRRLVGRRAVTKIRAEEAIVDLLDFDVTRYPHLPFAERIWELRANLSAYDAAFVALAEALEAELVTTDRRLVGASGVRVPIAAP
jgi:predicted nucleic acid-binding protein